MTIIQDLLPIGHLSRKSGKVYAKTSLTIHDTGNVAAGADALRHAKFAYNRADKLGAHYYVDDHSIYQTIPDGEQANHCGSSKGNRYSIGIEICINKDGDFKKALENTVWLVLMLCNKYGFTLEDIFQHHYWNGKDCPATLRKSGWKEFLAAIEAKLGGTGMVYEKTIKSSDIIKIAPVMGLNNKAESMESVKARTGATYVINGGTFSKTVLNTYKVDSMLILDTNVLSLSYCQFGFAMKDNQFAWSYQNKVNWPNFVGGFGLLVKSGIKEIVNNLKDTRGRTAIGVTSTGEFVFYCCAEGSSAACTIDELADIMLARKCVHAIFLDGSYSSQAIGPDGMVTYPAATKRNALWYICIWTKPISVATTIPAITVPVVLNTFISAKANSKTSVYNVNGVLETSRYIAKGDLCKVYTNIMANLLIKVDYPSGNSIRTAYIKSLDGFVKL